MGLNIVKPGSNMYQGWITHTWNTVKGACPHDCSYCYMKRWKNLKPARFDEKELNTDLGSGNYIFVGSSNDLYVSGHPYEWISKTLYHCKKYPENKYLFQTKNPEEVIIWSNALPENAIICTTLESNRWYPDHMGKSPYPFNRMLAMKRLYQKKYITIEPIMDFGLGAFVEMIKSCNPIQVNIGADSGNNHLPEPSWDKVVMLINRLNEFTKVVEKPNLGRLERELHYD